MISTEKAREAINAAKQEIAQENLQKAVNLLKAKLREREAAQTILQNVDRSIAELELKIEQGNV